MDLQNCAKKALLLYEIRETGVFYQLFVTMAPIPTVVSLNVNQRDSNLKP